MKSSQTFQMYDKQCKMTNKNFLRVIKLNEWGN